MTIFLILLYLLNTNIGAVASPIVTSATELLASASSESSPSSSHAQRSISSIIWSCFATMFACLWVSVHPNVPGKDEDDLTIGIRRAKIMFWALVAPECVIVWAARQYFGANRIQERYKEYGWTRTHGHFLQMGGFVLCENDATRLLDYDEFNHLVTNGKVTVPTTLEKEIKDHSKGDAFTKSVVILQTLWFVVQCVARWAQHLPLTQLELVTLAFASLNGVMYFFWWDKPLDVRCAIRVSVGQDQLLTTENSEAGEAATQKDTAGCLGRLLKALDDAWHADDQSFDEMVEAITKLPGFEHWYPEALDRAVYPILRPLISVVFLLACSPSLHNKTHLPPFYSVNPDEPTEDKVIIRAIHIGTIVGIMFGAIHCLGWRYEFPSNLEVILWQIGSVAVSMTPLMIAFGYAFFRRQEMPGPRSYLISNAILLFLCIIYIFGRIVLLVEALICLRALPKEVFYDVNWINFVPHV